MVSSYEATQTEQAIPNWTRLEQEQVDTLRELLELDDDDDLDTLVDSITEVVHQRDEYREALAQLQDVVNFEAVLDDPPKLDSDKNSE